MHNRGVERRVVGTSAYVYNSIRLELDEPLRGDNNSLIYVWRAVRSGHVETGRVQKYFVGKPIRDDDRGREEIISVLYRHIDPYLVQRSIPVWNQSSLPAVPFKRAA